VTYGFAVQSNISLLISEAINILGENIMMMSLTVEGISLMDLILQIVVYYG
jgi:hypothetical protein